MSLKDKILNINDVTREVVKIDEWGLEVEVRSMTGAARAAIVQAGAVEGKSPDLNRFTADIVVMCTFDPETGEQVFDETDAASVMEKNGAALEKIVTVAMRLSGFAKDAVDVVGKDS
jgi:3-hydroxyisobutyrate dehydrogenase-like beta-hydroxyacid dehydrogenase